MLRDRQHAGRGTRLSVDGPGRSAAAGGCAGAHLGEIMADKLKIMLVDDHYLVRMGLASIIALEPDMTVCAEASTGEQARALFRTQRPDVTLMDLRLPGHERVRDHPGDPAEFPDARIVMLSTYVCDEEIYGALQAGAMAYLVKSVQREELIARDPEGGRRPAAHPAGSGGPAGGPRVAIAAFDAGNRGAAAAGRRPAQPRDRDGRWTSPKAR